MKRILIADAGKASLVMTSEVLKDFFPGVQVVVARTSAETLDIINRDKAFDAVVVDYDLPDRDGAETAARIKKVLQTPVLVTGFDRPGVDAAIVEELAAYDDCMNWIRKPVRAETLVSIVQRYCDGRYRTQRRVECEVPVLFELAVPVTTLIPMPNAKGVASKTIGAKVSSKVVKGAKGVTGAKGSVASKSTKLKKSEPTMKEVTTINRTWIPAFVQDCSVGGVKLRVPRSKVEALSLAKHASAAVSAISSGEVLSIQLPSWDQIARVQALSSSTVAKTGTKTTADKIKKSSVGDGKTLSLKADDAKNSSTKNAVSMRGRVAWSLEPDEASEWLIGLQAENAAFAKRLFEAVIAAQKSATSSTHSG